MINITDFLKIDEVFDTLKRELSHSGINLLKDIKMVNNNIMITCPYHGEPLGQERRPSMGVSLKEHNKGTCNCFTCGKTVSFQEMVSNVFGYNDGGIYGTKWLLQKYDFISPDKRKPITVIPSKKEVNLTPRSWEDYAQYSSHLYETDYLDKRGIPKKVQSSFSIGFDPQSRHIIFPVTNGKHELMYLQSRNIDVKYFYIEEDAPKAYCLFGLDHVNDYYDPTDEINSAWLDMSKLYVVESAIDAMYLWTYGKMAVATSQAIPTDEQLQLINNLPIKTIVAAQDNDEAGWRGAAHTRKKLKNKLVKRFHIKNYDYKDMNDLPPEMIIDEKNITLIY